jgi:rubrerythrin
VLSERDKDLQQAVELAIYREIGARNFYRRISDGIDNSEGKEKFSQLSRDEENHRIKLESWYEKMTGGAFSPDDVRLEQSEIRGLAVDGQTGALEALNIAIGAETQAREFYEGQAERASDPELRRLFEQLAEEEAGHFALLEAERNSIIGGFYWFDMDNTAFLED